MEKATKLPQKRFFRQRAHVNIFNDMPLEYPLNPDLMDWSGLYPSYFRKHDSLENDLNLVHDHSSSDIKSKITNTLDSNESGISKKKILLDQDNGKEAVNNVQMDISHDIDYTRVEFADIGCGYGGLLVALAPLFPNTLMLGMEIRTKLVDYLQKRIEALRLIQDKINENKQNSLESFNTEEEKLTEKSTDDILDADFQKIQETGETKKLVAGRYKNIGVMRMNAMKYLPNFFRKGQLSKVFFLFPDPHFKKRKHKARIISETLLAEYAYITKVGGILYTVTDVEDLHIWMKSHLDRHPLFDYIPNEEIENDPVVHCVYNSTEEGRKVTRNKGQKFLACYRRIEDSA
ncbi:hypothetical protein BB559_003110 [Furculomyces boomerangus]|uniref:tRNA (guanine-N(7)-)-methyltransferase n=2 Tax=Harpellales TaxID=61421 RepID=A0A2T9YNT8_9FUNG|nr:hypothetical protein BB559_003110 [Furculomyces boomerangus]PWA02750.1 hypothetical protein BB558_001106 [Smittium angustum]